MKRTVFALAVAALAFAAVPALQAAPIAPLPAVLTVDHGTVTVQWRHHHWWGYRHCYWRHGWCW